MQFVLNVSYLSLLILYRSDKQPFPVPRGPSQEAVVAPMAAMLYQHSQLRAQHNWEKRWENLASIVLRQTDRGLNCVGISRKSFAYSPILPPPVPQFVYIEIHTGSVVMRVREKNPFLSK